MEFEKLLGFLQENLYLALAIAIFIDNSSLMTMPGQLVLMLMGQLIYQGGASPLLVFITAILSGILGGSVGYGAGRLLSGIARPLLRRFGKLDNILLSLERKNLVDDYGPIIVLAIFAYQLEWLTSIAPGFLKLPYKKFLFYDTIAVCLYVFVFTTLGGISEALSKTIDLPFVNYARYIIVLGAIIAVALYTRKTVRRLLKQQGIENTLQD